VIAASAVWFVPIVLGIAGLAAAIVLSRGQGVQPGFGLTTIAGILRPQVRRQGGLHTQADAAADSMWAAAAMAIERLEARSPDTGARIVDAGRPRRATRSTTSGGPAHAARGASPRPSAAAPGARPAP
jgi:hypothetical protein